MIAMGLHWHLKVCEPLCSTVHSAQQKYCSSDLSLKTHQNPRDEAALYGETG